MQTFVDDLLDLQKIENHEFKLDNQTVFDPNEALELVCTIFAPQTKKKNVNFTWLKMQKLPFPIESDKE
jgi:signal transduction histidine kinase